ncbi:MAG: 5'-methylthioadenosine/adenosylhomocysteine nucleosidase [Clostridia bacterium]|nr:5'-methylthioadenosine/adenosylhomocysteine nucleosidase [Clostridia bacterium]
MVGIIVAEPQELEAVKKHMKNTIIEEKYDLKFHIGDIGNKRFAVVLCGMGKVNAARTTQTLIDNYKPDYVINCGVAGGLNDIVKIGDIVIGEKIVQYDFDLTAFGREKGEVSDKVGKFVHSDKSLVEKAYGVIVRDDSISGIVGTIATADRFMTDPEEAKKVAMEFGADCCEMEGAAIAQVCFLDNVPFVVIRSISDTPNNNNKVDFDEFIGMAAENVAKLIIQFVQQ